MFISIHQGAKSIISYLIEIAIEKGDLFEELYIEYDKTIQKLGLPNKNFLLICLQYLQESDLIQYTEYKENAVGRIILSVPAINFLEEK